jgi:hypothetical protein
MAKKRRRILNRRDLRRGATETGPAAGTGPSTLYLPIDAYGGIIIEHPKPGDRERYQAVIDLAQRCRAAGGNPYDPYWREQARLLDDPELTGVPRVKETGS